ncbi:MAG: hypothetical protein QOG20_2026 [Pseudonocardiales bacterium]|jgi:hypothetical protein|nr:hypothetical protein [Pseudonocardiales bacterium]
MIGDHGVMIGVKPHGGVTTAADYVAAVARVDRDVRP